MDMIGHERDADKTMRGRLKQLQLLLLFVSMGLFLACIDRPTELAVQQSVPSTTCSFADGTMQDSSVNQDLETPLPTVTQTPVPAPTPFCIAGQAFSGEETSLQLIVKDGADLKKLDLFSNLQAVDLTGSCCYADLLTYQNNHPQIDVTYAVRIGKDMIQNDASEAAVETLPDVSLLAYLPELRRLTLLEPLNPEEGKKLLELLPEAELHYRVQFAGFLVDHAQTSLDISSSSSEDVDEIVAGIAALPNLTNICISASDATSDWTLEDVGKIQRVRDTIAVDYTIEAFGVTFSLTDKVVDLNHISLRNRMDELKSLLPYLRNVGRLDMEECGIADDQMAALRAEFSSPEIVWRVHVGHYDCRTDAIMIRFSDNDDLVKLHDKDVIPLQYCNKVRYLDLGHNLFTHIDFVQHMPELQVAILAVGAVEDILEIAACTKLEYCELFSGNIEDVSPLAACTELRDLNLAYNDIQDISPLFGLKNLKRLWISNNPMEKGQIETLQKLLPECEVNTTSGNPTGLGWRYDYPDGAKYLERYILLRKQFCYDTPGIHSYTAFSPYNPDL